MINIFESTQFFQYRYIFREGKNSEIPPEWFRQIPEFRHGMQR